MHQKVPENHIFELLEDLSGPEIDYVVARSRTNTDASAFREAGVSKRTFYTWPAEWREHLNTLADELRRNRWAMVELKLRGALEMAVDELIEIAKKPRTSAAKLRAIERIIDETRGRPVQRQEITGGEGGPIEIALLWPEEDEV
jgi:hypothetical protein